MRQLDSAISEYREHEKILNNNKDNFVEAKTKFNDLYQKFRGAKIGPFESTHQFRRLPEYFLPSKLVTAYQFPI